MKNTVMKASLVASISLLASFSSFARLKPDIVGGDLVTNSNEAPFMASMDVAIPDGTMGPNGKPYPDGTIFYGACGGSLISSRWVLTAAHCADGLVSLKTGTMNLKEAGVFIKAKQVVVHPSYSPFTSSNDFALVELENEIDFSSTRMKPLKLADAAFDEAGFQAPGVAATIYGWGNLKEGKPGPNTINFAQTLRKVTVPIVSNEVANAVYEVFGYSVDETMISAGVSSGGKDSCQGDSGGPMVVFDQQNEPVQVGVVSWGIGCARPAFYGVYSRVSSAHAWMEEVTGLDL